MEDKDGLRNYLRDLLAANVQIGNLILSVVENLGKGKRGWAIYFSVQF